MYFDPLSVTLTTNIFSHSVGFLFVLLMGSTVVQKLLSLIRSHLFLCVCQVALSCPTLCNAMGCAAHQAPLSMGFPRQDTGVGCHFLLQGIFLTQGQIPHLLHWHSLPLCHLGVHPICLFLFYFHYSQRWMKKDLSAIYVKRVFCLYFLPRVL